MLYDLTVNGQLHPLGLDEKPRFSWKIKTEKQNVMQKAYRIQVIRDGKMTWDSGLVENDVSTFVPYEGPETEAFAEYLAQVSVWDSDGELHQSTITFETGMKSEDHFAGQWITHSLDAADTRCPVFHRHFSAEKALAAARLYVTAAGVYEAQINGCKTGDAFMAPGWTSYAHRIQYQAIDVTDLIGHENELCVTLGNGWYKGELGFDARGNIYGDRTGFRAMLRLVFQDGSVETVSTDEQWDVTTGPILSSEIYYGEVQDLTAPAESIGKALPFDASGIGQMVAQEDEPVRITKRFPVQKKIITPKGEVVLDFGQNLTGLVEVRLPALQGDRLIIRHAETLDAEGNFYTENLRTATSTDTYVYGPEQVGLRVMPHFTFHGFRYIALEGVGQDVDTSAFTACAMHTDMHKTVSLTTGNPLVDRLILNVEWGQRDNFFDIPTDCPQRNERLGWTGDAQVFASTAAIQFDTSSFFKKWLRDMAAETTAQYGTPHVVPNILGDQEGAAAWSDAAVIIPWRQYQAFGDKALLLEQYPMMKTWVDYMHSHASENGLWQTGFQYGDWLALDIESGSTDRTGGTDRYLVANAYYAYSTGILRDTAAVLGLKEDQEAYSKLYDEIVEAINREYITATGRLVCETQTACVLMLYFNLAKPDYRARILKTLTDNIAGHRNHLTTGFVGTPYLCHCLSENGFHDLANAIFLKEDFPGWLYAVKKGATTIWERWNSILPDGSFDQSGMNSLNHYAYGSIAGWLYEKVAGISMLAPGYKRFRIRPMLTLGLKDVKASFETVYGQIRSEVSCANGKIRALVAVPANTTAEIWLPEKAEAVTVGSGTYTWEYETTTSLDIQKFSVDSTLGELVAEDLGRKLFNELAPGMLDTPMIQYAFGMTIAELIGMDAAGKPLYMAVIDALNRE